MANQRNRDTALAWNSLGLGMIIGSRILENYFDLVERDLSLC
jgi:hypothetical protein